VIGEKKKVARVGASQIGGVVERPSSSVGTIGGTEEKGTGCET